MRNLIIASVIAVLCLVVLLYNYQSEDLNTTIQTPPGTKEHYIGTFKSSYVPVRLLVLKHCPDDIADTDARQAIQAANLAASEGLDIEDIGNFHIDKSGGVDSKLTWGAKFNDLEGLKQFISLQMKVQAKEGDTLVIYTIGHGSGSGSVMRLGQREGIMRIIAEAAEENGQETLWWQLSCHAAAKLPEVSILNERQRQLFSMTASSPADKLSYFCTQGEQLKKLFVAMANNSPEIDPNQDFVITAGELARFLDRNVSPGRGDLVYADSENEPIFGWWDYLNMIPILDDENKQYPKNYIPFPR